MNANMNASNLLCQGSHVPFVFFQRAVGKSLIILLLQPCAYFVMQRKVIPSLLGSVEAS